MSILTKLKQKARELKSEAQVLMIAYKDKRTPVLAKILIGITVGYLLSPIDLIPDFIPVLGLLDDLIIVPLLIALSIKLIPESVLNDARKAIKSNPQQLKKTNRIFAILIICIWLSVLYYTYSYIRREIN
ncbi:MAG: YkvA family protein [Daejeonella sp.]